MAPHKLLNNILLILDFHVIGPTQNLLLIGSPHIDLAVSRLTCTCLTEPVMRIG
jgi:hypothetical protein